MNLDFVSISKACLDSYFVKLSKQFKFDFSKCPQCNKDRFAHAMDQQVDDGDLDLFINRNIYKCINCNLSLQFEITNASIGFETEEEEEAYIPEFNEVEIRFKLQSYSVGIFYSKNESRLWTLDWPSDEGHYIIMNKVLLKPNLTDDKLSNLLYFLGPESVTIGGRH